MWYVKELKLRSQCIICYSTKPQHTKKIVNEAIYSRKKQQQLRKCWITDVKESLRKGTYKIGEWRLKADKTEGILCSRPQFILDCSADWLTDKPTTSGWLNKSLTFKVRPLSMLVKILYFMSSHHIAEVSVVIPCSQELNNNSKQKVDSPQPHHARTREKAKWKKSDILRHEHKPSS